MADFKYGDITEKTIGAAFRVHTALGNGFQEVIYQRALELELKVIPFNYSREFEMPIYYLDQHSGTRRVDFLIEGKISVELKAITKLEDVHLAQAMNYLEAYNLEIGLLKKCKPNVIQHPVKSQSSQKSQFRRHEKNTTILV